MSHVHALRDAARCCALRRPLPRWPRWLCRPWTQRPAEADSAASPGPPLRERPRPVPSSRPPGPPSGPGVRQSVRQNRREAKEETSETPLRQSCSGHDRNTAFSTAISPASLLQWLSHQTANYKISNRKTVIMEMPVIPCCRISRKSDKQKLRRNTAPKGWKPQPRPPWPRPGLPERPRTFAPQRARFPFPLSQSCRANCPRASSMSLSSERADLCRLCGTLQGNGICASPTRLPSFRKRSNALRAAW